MKINYRLENFMLFCQTIILLLIRLYSVYSTTKTNDKVDKAQEEIVYKRNEFNIELEKAQKNYDVLLDEYLEMRKNEKKS